ncbi:putative transmembrane anti-sigma factor [Burkholderia sp. lig30]|jgi:anti-sigma factor RsiW|uniref:zf-HC2 domain-containing protein n=1 Tax=Burkholderia sp. lig30 TaxID=1192124 RepID=UPI000461F9DB|nr:zf-HC2 domain-containing protein [Burkholderia sp. lig30]KDB06773.1 putative transmembrane anti-sigma factor [Burkholderia sp. lig30]
MDCNETRMLLDADVDRELPPTDALRVQRHVDGCDACRRERETLAALGRVVRQAGYHRAPDALHARIAAALPAGARREPLETRAARPAGWRGWLRRVGWGAAASAGAGTGTGTGTGTGVAGAGAKAGGPAWAGRPFAALPAGWLAGLALALALGAAGGAALTAQRLTADRLADELVASHIRAGLSARDVDVVSTDRHTVKPWFNGRLDYAPPVADLSANGFVLAGGRLDYVGQRRVAVLVYRYRQHLIDVYVFPGTDGLASRAAVRQGYALERWQAAGMTWWAVTDAEPSALAAFRAALTARVTVPRTE